MCVLLILYTYVLSSLILTGIMLLRASRYALGGNLSFFRGCGGVLISIYDLKGYVTLFASSKLGLYPICI
jgi:hypothetical protein